MNQPASQSVAINQKLVGTSACTMLVGAGLLWFLVGSQNMWTGACLKVGLVMGALWLALPSLKRKGSWGHTSWGVIVLTVAVALVLTGKRVDMRIILPLLVGIVLTTKVLRPGSLPKRK